MTWWLLGRSRLVKKIVEEIEPIGIVLFDQFDFPIAPPILYLLFAHYGGLRARVRLGVDQCCDAVVFREALEYMVFVLPYSGRQIAGHANIERSAHFAGHNVDEELPLQIHTMFPTPPRHPGAGRDPALFASNPT